MTPGEKLCMYSGTIALALLLRSAVSLHGHSGEGVPPMYGDYEAQRHWQEITINLPIHDWYRNTSDNDLMYWGLDYPPLTAYYSFLLGRAARVINGSYVELHKSRGISSSDHKYFMRWSVLLVDLLVYVPAVYVAMQAVSKLNSKRTSAVNENIVFISTLLALIYPGQILIDNGHFQYNNMSLGLLLFAVAAICADHRILSAILFSLALNYKQMELYHALPFFVYLLRDCFTGKRQSFAEGFGNLLALGGVVILTFAIIWSPWISSPDALLGVVRRIFPLARGVFEDKVANVWCVVNVFVKLKDRHTNEMMALICLATTLAASLPSCVHLFFSPSKLNFIYSLVNTSSAFFLFSYQVVVDESDGCGGKFNALVVSPQFEGKTLIQRHRLVNSALSEELKTIHAFSQKTFTPKQWAEQQSN